MIDSLIFDFDGVIIDTETPAFETLQEIYNYHGVDLDRLQWQQIIGGGSKDFDPFEHLETLTGKSLDWKDIEVKQRKRYMDLVHDTPVMPGVIDYISDAIKLGLRLAVASSSSRDWVEGHLDKRGLIDSFDAIITRDDVTKVKPEPEIYVTSAERLGTIPERSIAIEDSFHGLTAAKLSGMYCIVVPNPMTIDMPFDAADLLLGTLSEMELRDVLRIANTRPRT